MVGHATVEKESEKREVDYQKIQSDDFTKLSKVVGGRYLLSTVGLNQLSSVYEFAQIRIQCSKPYHRRTLDIMTTTNSKGRWARDWLLGRRSAEPQPPSCGSYERLAQDTSYLGNHCNMWLDETWWNNMVYFDPMEAYVGGVSYVGVNLYGGDDFCDDNSNHPHFNNVGQWSFYVR